MVKGNIGGLNDSKIMVLRFIGNSFEVDSISPENNQFEYTGKVEEPYFVQFLIKNEESSTKLCEFMLENSEINITGNSIDFDSVKVSGSESDKILKDYFSEDKLLDEKWDDLKLKYDQYVESDDTLNRKSSAKKLNHIIQVERVELVKKYVREYSNKKTGALIPSFCSIEDKLTKEDYTEIYNYLTPEIQQTGYGKRILEKITGEE
jgi:uncharacterized protein DUF4369